MRFQKPGSSRSLLLILSLATACNADWQAEDADGDGVSLAEGDCWDQVEGPQGSGLLGADIHPGADEDWYDGFDQDCAGDDDYDADKDGFVPSAFLGLSTYGLGQTGDLPGGDCWDDPDAVPDGFTAAPGYPQSSALEVNPAATSDTWYDGIDQDCAGDSDFDQDQDGYESSDDPQADGSTGEDCNDQDPQLNPLADEVCDNLDNDCDELVDGADDSVDPESVRTWYLDEDGDDYGGEDSALVSCDELEGYILQGGDCADDDADRNPAADELCNEIDDDCNGSEDEAAVDAPTWYLDGDADGFGDLDEAVAACDAPKGYVGNADDCADADDEIHPGADELCATAGVDDDCDELVDEAGASDGDLFYLDFDGDGYGLGGATTRACELPVGYSEVAGDCNDASDLISPDADERCATVGVDDDCDDDVDESSATDARAYYADVDDDGYGNAAVSVPGCTAPAGYVSNTQDCDDACGSCWTGAPEECNDYEDNDCDGTANDCAIAPDLDLADVDVHIQGTSSGGDLGLASGSGDMDGDGFDDLVLGARDAGGGAGQSYVILGPIRGSSTVSAADLVLTGEASDDRSGRSVAMTDVDRDGYDDVVIGSTNMGGGSARGGAYVVYGPATGILGLGSADWILEHPDNYTYMGRKVAALGDVTDDTRKDVGIASNLATIDATADGAVYMMTWPGSGEDDITTEATAVLNGAAAGDGFGRSLAGVGDVDGDGVKDMLVGAWLADTGGSAAGAASLFLGPVDTDRSAAEADATWTGEAAGDYAGDAVGGGGDFDGDGLDDMVVGAYAQASSDRGAAYLLRGRTTPTGGSLSGATSIVRGVSSSQRLGMSVDLSGDLDMDGRADLVVGDGGRDECSSSDGAGATYLFYSSLPGSLDSDDADTVIAGTAAGDCAGAAAMAPGDLTGDGYPDLLVGAPGADGVGGAYIVLGVGM